MNLDSLGCVKNVTELDAGLHSLLQIQYLFHDIGIENLVSFACIIGTAASCWPWAVAQSQLLAVTVRPCPTYLSPGPAPSEYNCIL